MNAKEYAKKLMDEQASLGSALQVISTYNALLKAKSQGFLLKHLEEVLEHDVKRHQSGEAEEDRCLQCDPGLAYYE